MYCANSKFLSQCTFGKILKIDEMERGQKVPPSFYKYKTLLTQNKSGSYQLKDLTISPF